MYDDLADLVEKNSEALTLRIVELEEKFLKTTFEPEGKQLRLNAYKFTFEVISRYVRSGKAEEWRDFIQTVARYDLSLGRSSSTAIAMGEALVRLVKDLIDAEWPAPSDEKLRQRFYRRMDSMHALAQITTTVSHIKKPE
jgi:hypothetical protein